MELTVRQPGTMCEQIAERDRTPSWDRVVQRAFRILDDARVSEFRGKARDGVVEPEPRRNVNAATVATSRKMGSFQQPGS